MDVVVKVRLCSLSLSLHLPSCSFCPIDFPAGLVSGTDVVGGEKRERNAHPRLLADTFPPGPTRTTLERREVRKRSVSAPRSWHPFLAAYVGCVAQWASGMRDVPSSPLLPDRLSRGNCLWGRGCLGEAPFPRVVCVAHSTTCGGERGWTCRRVTSTRRALSLFRERECRVFEGTHTAKPSVWCVT
jgi:hypothetical protein